MNKKALLLEMWICLVLLSFLSPAHAAIPVVTPNEGTIGTTFTISGEDFGAKKGTVFIGSRPCQVLAWNDTTIECLINVPMRPGEYDVSLDPQGHASKVILSDAFTIRPPELNEPSSRPQFVAAGQTITIGGTFLGGRHGLKKVEIESLEGDKRPCPILESAMDFITFVLPDGIPGRFNIRYTNGAGTVVLNDWGTFAESPNLPPPMPHASYGGVASNDTAAAVSYNNKLWVFWPSRDSDNYTIKYRRWDGENWGDIHDLHSAGTAETSHAQLTPIVVHNILYIFYTGTNGGLYYDTYNAGAMDQTKAWTHNRIADAAMANLSGRFAAVWNFTKDCIEVYWTPNTTDIYMKTYDVKTGNWSTGKTVAIARWPGYPNVAPYLSAVFNQLGEDDYVTYLSWDDHAFGSMTELKDGVELRTLRYSYWQANNTNRGPSLVDLGETQLAVLYNHGSGSNQSHYVKYDKINHRVVGGNDQTAQIGVPYSSSQDTSWAPNGVVFSTKTADAASPTGYRMDSRFYALVENNPTIGKLQWELVKCEYLGYWMPRPEEPAHVDLGGSDNQSLIDNFPYWPVLGVVDMPPFVQNGHGECTDCTACGTEVELNFTQATTHGISGEYSAGGYVSTRARSKVVVDVSAGYSGGFENKKTFAYTHTDSLEGNVEGRIFAYYLVPSFDVYTLEWYDLNAVPTEITTTSMQLVGTQVRKEVFAPSVGPVMYTDTAPYLDPGFPTHNGEDDHTRLDSYIINPTDAYHNFETIVDPLKSTSTWAIDSPAGFSWSIDEEHSIDHGFYADLKFGYKFSKIPIGVGFKGSIEILVNTTTQTGVEAITNLKNRGPVDSDPSRVTEFTAVGYWLKPNAAGYWVPENRKEMGDAPWFITYRVTDYWHP